MTRNLRTREHPCPNPVSTYEVAPDFFNTAGSYDAVAEILAERWSEFRDAHPYKPGMVVWVQYGDEMRKAFIADVFPERDREGSFRAKYRIHLANKAGDQFAKNWFYTWPGFVQRGYLMAKGRPK